MNKYELIFLHKLFLILIHLFQAFGLPLIGAMYENDPNVGLYTLPLLIWHPLQLFISSALVPKLKLFMQVENKKLGVKTFDFEEDSNEASKTEDSMEEQVELDSISVTSEDEENQVNQSA